MQISVISKNIFLVIFIYLSTGKHLENIELYRKQESNFIEYGNSYLCGSIFTNLGISLRNVGRNTEALRVYDKAGRFHKQSGHQVYLATIENNLAYIYRDEKLFTKAHQATDNATNIFCKINERAREGYSCDTKAQSV